MTKGRLGVATLMLALAVIGTTAWGGALRHTKLVRSLPSADTTMASPEAIQLWFSDKPEARLTAISLLRADSSRISLGPVKSVVDPLLVEAKVLAPLQPGAYAVVWRTASPDGHVVRGRFEFQVVAAP